MTKWIGIAALLVLAACHTPEVEQSSEKATPEGRDAYELERLKDPATGEIPIGMRMRELAFASTLPKASSSLRASKQVFTAVGPYNVGGRTRAIAYDQSNPSILLAGAISGGMWRSTDNGQSWTRVTTLEQHAAVSCVVQDTRTGRTNTWYYGSGETRGNSASKSFSAAYRGTGVYKSTDNGITWTQLSSTETRPHQDDVWSYVFRMVIDPTRNDSDVVVAATHRGIFYSNSGGDSWKQVLGGVALDDLWTEIVVSSTGVFYAALSSNVADGGIWRSEDGLNWVRITAAGFPTTHERTVMSIAPSNENMVYVFSETPGVGTVDNPNDNTPEYHSFWRYTYLTADGSGGNGQWQDRSLNLPSGGFRETLSTFSGYTMGIAVKPDNENIVFIGGTSMFRSTNGFANTTQTNQIGGYDADGYADFNWRRDNHHPDMQYIIFHPDDPDYLLCSTDGGMHFTADCEALPVIWESYNNGFISAQFYAIAVDNNGNNTQMTGGMQDNGSWWSDALDATEDWVSLRGSDGAYTAIAENGSIHYLSTQYANVQRARVDANGNVLSREDAMPDQAPGGSGSGYLFVHPFTLDPADENRMYLPHFNRVYTNTNLSNLDMGVKNWVQSATISSGTISAIGASKQPEGVVYVGTTNRRIYRLDNAHTGNAAVTEVSNGISNGSYTSCIAVDPRDAEKLVVIYSNYNVVSLWYSEDGGQNWTDVEGNLKGTADPGVPPQLGHIGDGPSCRWMEIVPVSATETVYLLGTSVGLFATNTLDGDSTVWIQQGADVIGNVVVDMVDTRSSDGFTAIGTHGNGMFSTYIENNFDITSADLTEAWENLNMKVFPNPATDVMHVSFELPATEQVKASVFDLQGRKVLQTERGLQTEGTHQFTWDLSQLPGGTYFVRLRGESFDITKPIVKQ